MGEKLFEVPQGSTFQYLGVFLSDLFNGKNWVTMNSNCEKLHGLKADGRLNFNIYI